MTKTVSSFPKLQRAGEGARPVRVEGQGKSLLSFRLNLRRFRSIRSEGAGRQAVRQ